jgi:hypothetical protein
VSTRNYLVGFRATGDPLPYGQHCSSRLKFAHGHLPFLRGIPCLDKRTLRLICVVLCADFLDSDFSAVFGEDNILLLHLLDTALGELVGVEEDLRDMSKQLVCAICWEVNYLVSDPCYAPDNCEKDEEWDEVQRAHGGGDDDDVARLVLR